MVAPAQAAAALVENPIRATPATWPDPASLPPRPWIMGRWLLRNTVFGVIAPGGAGKSTFLMTLALSLASGRPLLGKEVHGEPKRVWLWNLEDDGDELARQRIAAALAHGVHPSECGDRLFVDSGPDGATLCTAIEDRAGFRIIAPVMEAVVAEILARRIDVLMLDPFVSSHQIDENNNGMIDAVTKAWARVAKLTGCAIGLSHHTIKAKGERITTDSSRGASALANTARSMLVLNRMTPEEAQNFGLDPAAARSYVNIGDDKHNRAPAERADWYELRSVELGQGDSVGVIAPWAPPSPLEGVTPEHLSLIQRVLSGGDYRKSPQSPEWAGHVIGKVLRIDAEESGNRARLGKLIVFWDQGRDAARGNGRGQARGAAHLHPRRGNGADGTRERCGMKLALATIEFEDAAAFVRAHHPHRPNQSGYSNAMPEPFSMWLVGTPKAQPRGRHVKGHVVSTADPFVRLWRAGIEAGVAAAGRVEPFAGAVKLTCVFTFAPPKSAPRRVGLPHTHKPDLDNLEKSLMDALVKAGLVRDDCLFASVAAEKYWDFRAGVALTVEPFHGRRDAAPAEAAAPDWLRQA